MSNNIIYATGEYGHGRPLLVRLRKTITGNRYWWDISSYYKRFNTVQEAIDTIKIDYPSFKLITDQITTIKSPHE